MNRRAARSVRYEFHQLCDGDSFDLCSVTWSYTYIATLNNHFEDFEDVAASHMTVFSSVWISIGEYRRSTGQLAEALYVQSAAKSNNNTINCLLDFRLMNKKYFILHRSIYLLRARNIHTSMDNRFTRRSLRNCLRIRMYSDKPGSLIFYLRNVSIGGCIEPLVSTGNLSLLYFYAR